VTKDNQRQAMSELLAQQRAGPTLTPSEAARHRRSAQREPVPDSVDAGSQEDLAATEETLAEEGHGAGGQRAEVIEAAAADTDVQARTRITGTLVAAACAVVVAVVCWQVAGRRRQAQRRT